MALPIAEPVPVVLNDDDEAAREARARRRARATLLPTKLAPEALSGAYIVYYRAIRGRPVEIFSWSVLPTDTAELSRYMHVCIPSYCHSHVENVLPFIPEYADLAKKEKETRDEDESYDIARHMATYELLAAAYDPTAKRIITMSLGVPAIFARELYRELYEKRLEEAAAAIVAHFAELGRYAPRRTL